VKGFLQAAVSFFSNGSHPVCETVVERLSAVNCSPETYTLSAQDREPLARAHLAKAFASRDRIELTKDLAAISEDLIWREASRDKFASFMGGKHAITQMIGPEAGFYSDQLRFGAFLLAPDTFYPLHSHAAEEIYVPISGSGHWKLKDASFAPKGPGSVVHLNPWIPHAIRSGGEPLLMLWVWFGNIDFEAYQIEANAFD
jgi:mannose-6-phosphate isomerase-like protein (cupin superfamily)